MSVSFARRDCWIFDLDGTLTVSIHDFDGIKRILGLPIERPILEALNDLPTAQADRLHQQLDALELNTVYLDPTGAFPWQDRADLSITTLAEIAAML